MNEILFDKNVNSIAHVWIIPCIGAILMAYVTNTLVRPMVCPYSQMSNQINLHRLRPQMP